MMTTNDALFIAFIATLVYYLIALYIERKERD